MENTIDKLALEYIKLTARHKEDGKRIDELKKIFEQAAGPALYIETENARSVLVPQKRRGLDTKAITEDFPEIAGAYFKDTFFNKITIQEKTAAEKAVAPAAPSVA